MHQTSNRLECGFQSSQLYLVLKVVDCVPTSLFFDFFFKEKRRKMISLGGGNVFYMPAFLRASIPKSISVNRHFSFLMSLFLKKEQTHIISLLCDTPRLNYLSRSSPARQCITFSNLTWNFFSSSFYLTIRQHLSIPFVNFVFWLSLPGWRHNWQSRVVGGGPFLLLMDSITYWHFLTMTNSSDDQEVFSFSASSVRR